MQPPEFGDNFDPEDMEAWLAEVELVHEKIKKLADEKANHQENDEEILKLRQKRQDQEKKKEEAKKQVLQLREEEERKGRKGKGQSKDYASYCKYCQLEYVKVQEKCYWCKRDTLTLEQRHAQLQKMVEEYKEMKNRKQQKKQKFELMDKTEKILWKKTTFTHKKWEYYTSSEEEIESEPIVPKDDPNFKALELDMEQRKKKKEEDMKKAESLRLRGNEYYSKAQYDHAAWKYSEALELVKDNKSLWLNRAIAYIKLNKNKKAISDCSKVIDYAECFENGYTQSRENCFKAFLRRALARYNRDRLDEAKKDIDQALQLIPDDKEAMQLRKDIEAKIDHYQRLKQLDEEKQQGENQQNEEKQQGENQQNEENQNASDKNSENSNQKEKQNTKQEQQQEKQEGSMQDLTFKQLIDMLVEGKEIELLYLFKALKQNQNEATAYFYEKKGLEQLINLIQKPDEKLHDQYNLLASLPALVLQIYQEKSLIYQEQFLIEYKGVEVIINKIDYLLKQVADKQTSAVYDTVADYFDVLNVLDESKPRDLIQKHPLIKTQIYPEFFQRIVSLYRKENDLVATFFSFCSNLCYGQNTPLKAVFYKSIKEILLDFINLFDNVEIKDQNIRMLNQLCNLIANLLTEDKIRNYFFSNQMNENFFKSLIQFLKKIQFKQNNDFTQLKENAIAILVNLTFQIQSEQISIVTKIENLVIVLVEYLSASKSTLLTERLLTVLAKVNYEDNIYLVTKHLKQFSSQSLRCLLQWLGSKSPKIVEQLKTKELYELLEELKQLLSRDEEIVYCNSCNVIGMIIDLVSPIQGERNACSYYNEMIPRLLGFAKDRVGNYRKNSAILLAKLTKDQRNLQSLRDLHGIEILQSIMGKM